MVLKPTRFMRYRRRGSPVGISHYDIVETERMDMAFGTSVDGIRAAPASSLEGIDHNEFYYWCVKNGVYQIPTEELIEALRELINGRHAIEICAGHGAVGRSLGIPLTDSYIQQTDPELRQIYAAAGQSITRPPKDVQKLEALEAVRLYKPEVVIGCFVTESWKPNVRKSFAYGVDEESIIKFHSVRRYIVVGNTNIQKNDSQKKTQNPL